MTTVKPLNWVLEDLGLWKAQTNLIACYSVWDCGDHWECSLLDGQFPSAEAAKSAAFADYSARIMSAIEPAGVGVETPPPSSHVAGSLWDQLVVLSGYHITRPPTPDHEFVQVCNGDLRKMVELMGAGSSHSSQTAGRWRAFEDTTPGYWGIELEDAGNDDDAIMYPQKIHRDTVARIVEAHNAALSPSPQPRASVPAALKEDEQ